MIQWDLQVALGIFTIISALFPYEVFSHVGEPCKAGFLRICTGDNIYCDDKNVCQCKQDYPVKIDPHKCLQARGYQQKCTEPKQCTYKDSNSYCTQVPFQSYCDCHTDFDYNEKIEKCLKKTKNNDKPNLTLPIAVVISLAFSCLLCCCLVMLHLFRRQNLANSRRFGFLGNSQNMTDQATAPPTSSDNTIHASSNLLPNQGDTLPSYDVAVSLEMVAKPGEVISEDECPPSYEDVIKGTVIKPNDTKSIPS